MSDPQNPHAIVKTLAESIPLKDAYEDIAQPVAREAGQALAQVGALVNSALRPIKTLQLAWNTLFDRLDSWLPPKLAGVAPDDIVEPPANVAGGVITGLLFAADEPPLRDMFVQLLATAMTKQMSQRAHPAFAEFIKQMTSLEARIVRAMAKHGDIATLTIRAHEKSDHHRPLLHPRRGLSSDEFIALLDDPPAASWVAEARLTSVDASDNAPPVADIAAAIGNLERLGLLKASVEVTFTDTTRYCKLAMCERALTIYERMNTNSTVSGLHPGILEVTSLGVRFMQACLPRKVKPSGS